MRSCPERIKKRRKMYLPISFRMGCNLHGRREEGLKLRKTGERILSGKHFTEEPEHTYNF